MIAIQLIRRGWDGVNRWPARMIAARMIGRGLMAATRSARRARLAWDRWVLWLELYDVGHGQCRCERCRDRRQDESVW